MIEEQNISIIKTRIWQTCSHVRPFLTDMQLIQIAIAFTFLRRIDCLVGKYAKECSTFYTNNKERLSDERLDEKLREISGGYPFYNYSGYTFSGILLANNSLDVVLNTYLQGFSQNVSEFLEGMNFKQITAILQRLSRHLVELFEFFSKLDLSNSSVDNEEFTELITSLRDGNFAFMYNSTPLVLSNLISECLFSVDVRNNANENTTIYDPVCGTGGLLAVAGGKAKGFAIHQDNISMYGQEVSIFPCAVAKALILLSGNDDSKVFYGNTLTDDMFSGSRFQYIVAELPIGLQWTPIKKRIEKESFGANGRFNIGLPNFNDSQFLFIEHILSKMDFAGSRAAFITTGSVLWGGNASSGESRIRRWLFEKDLIETIIALPSGTLSTTSIPVYLWILSNKKDDTQKGKVRLIDTTFVASKKKHFYLNDEFVKTVVGEYKSNIISTMSQIVKNEQFGYYEVDLFENGKKKETVTISLDTDIHDFVEKERQPYAKGKITIDYSSVEKGYSVLFEKFFEQEQIAVASLEEVTKDLVPVIDAISSLKSDIVKNIDRFGSESWEKLPLRAISEVVSGVNRPPVSNDEGLPLISVSYLRNPSSDDKLYEVTPRTKCSTTKDVIIISKGANCGEVFRGVDGILTPSVASIKCSNENVILPNYLYYLLKGYEKKLMAMAVGGSVIKSLNMKTILDLKCMIPPIEEQLKISSYLDDIIGRIDIVIKGLGSTGSVFSIYRQTLIENVVRGKVLIE